MNDEIMEVAENTTNVNGKMILGGLAVAGLGAGVYALGQFIYNKIKSGKSEETEVAEPAEKEE